MTNTNGTVIPASTTRGSALRYLSCLRPQDVLVLQGSPLLGAAFAPPRPGLRELGPLRLLMVAHLPLVPHTSRVNAWSGLNADSADPNKAARVFTAGGVGRREMVGLTVGFLIVSLLLFGSVGPVTLGLSLGIAALSALYSLPGFNWKARPLANSVTHLAGGMLHFLLGYSLGSVIDGRGLAIAGFFALIFAAGHLTQETRDHRSDAVNGIRTNAVVFGPRRTFAASLVLFTLAHGLLLALALQGLIPRMLAAVAALYAVQLLWSLEAFVGGLSYESVCRLQTRYRALYAIIGLAMMVALYGAPITIRG